MVGNGLTSETEEQAQHQEAGLALDGCEAHGDGAPDKESEGQETTRAERNTRHRGGDLRQVAYKVQACRQEQDGSSLGSKQLAQYDTSHRRMPVALPAAQPTHCCLGRTQLSKTPDQHPFAGRHRQG